MGDFNVGFAFEFGGIASRHSDKVLDADTALLRTFELQWEPRLDARQTIRDLGKQGLSVHDTQPSFALSIEPRCYDS
jgi:hypothetical protein